MEYCLRPLSLSKSPLSSELTCSFTEFLMTHSYKTRAVKALFSQLWLLPELSLDFAVDFSFILFRHKLIKWNIRLTVTISIIFFGSWDLWITIFVMYDFLAEKQLLSLIILSKIRLEENKFWVQEGSDFSVHILHFGSFFLVYQPLNVWALNQGY